jgi:hypothetical protein
MQRTIWPTAPVAQIARATCWSRRDLINRSYSWFRLLPRAARGDLLAAAGILAEGGRSFDRWRGLPVPAALSVLGLSLRAELVEGSGVVYLTGLLPPSGGLSDDVLRWAYLLLGAEVGRPIGARGSLVEISGRCHGPPERLVSDASPETSFHTDSDRGAIPDLVGVLCLAPAVTGGQCQIASATLAHELLKARCRDLLTELYEPFRRDDGDRGAAIFESDGRLLRFHYHRHRIETTHARVGAPLSHRQVLALDRLDEALADPLAHVQLQLKRGDVLLLNNRHIAHNRRPFIDHPDPAQRRRMVRMWLSLATGAMA